MYFKERKMDRLVCTFEVGSSVKGYGNERSDRDVIHFVKSPKSSYVRHFAGLENLLQNRQIEKDAIQSNLLTGLIGVYKGNYPHLWLYGNEETLKNEPELLDFVRGLGSARLKLVLRHLTRFGIRTRDSSTKRLLVYNSTKTMLQTLYNLSLADYCLTHGCRPETTAQLAMSHHLPSKYRVMFANLMVLRSAEQQQKSEDLTLDDTTSATTKDTLCKYADMIQEYREELWNKVECMPDPEERLDLLKNITEYFLYDISLLPNVR